MGRNKSGRRPGKKTHKRGKRNFQGGQRGGFVAQDEPQSGDMIVGIIEKRGQNFEIKSLDRKKENGAQTFAIDREGAKNAKQGDIAVGTLRHAHGYGRGKFHITAIEILGRKDTPGILSEIGIRESGLRTEFTPDVLAEVANMAVPALGNREDLRGLDIFTIDPATARDRDDAVWAEATPDGGHHLIVAIADVAHYVRPGTKLDDEAYDRGNSFYLPDRVIPMLPEKLSNELCSLAPNEDRAALAFHTWIDSKGSITDCKVTRALIKSRAALSYEQMQDAMDGKPNATTTPLMPRIRALENVYRALLTDRERREVLEISTPEYEIIFNAANKVTGVQVRKHLESHLLIEVTAVATNMTTPRMLEEKEAPVLYRIHEPPDPEKFEEKAGFIADFGIKLPSGKIETTKQFNAILKQAAGQPHERIVSEALLRATSKARYTPFNAGHFGLGVQMPDEGYAHSTSPIRRYADIVIHRLLIDKYRLGEGGYGGEPPKDLEEMGAHLSDTEEKAAKLERRTKDRYIAAFMAEQEEDAFFHGRIRDVAPGGHLFVALNDTGADVFVPAKALDKYRPHPSKQAKDPFVKGGDITVKITTNPLTGNITGRPVGPDGADLPRPPGHPRSRDGRKHRGPHRQARFS